MYFLVFVASIAISFWHLRVRQQNDNKLPLGPSGLPVLGNIHQLVVTNPFEKLCQWADKYGKIYTVDLGSKQAVIINDPNLMRDILNTLASTGSLNTESKSSISLDSYSIFNSDKKQSLLRVNQLKSFQFDNKRMETIILSEADEVRSWIKITNQKNQRESLVMKLIFIQSVINTLCTMIYGTKTALGDSQITQLLQTWSKSFQFKLKTGLTFLPWLKYLVPDPSGYTAYSNACLNILIYIEMQYMNQRKTIFPTEPDDDHTDLCIDDSINWETTTAYVFENFLPFSEITGSVLMWLLYYVSIDPEIQAKLHEEIDTIVGKNQEISLGLKSEMPFTESVILEAMRLSTFRSIGSVHELLEDLEIDTYKFPKGLILIPNVYYCHRNKYMWSDPDLFRPQRLLDKQGKKLKDLVIPFLQDRSHFFEETFAKDMLFLYVTKVFQHFDVHSDENYKIEDDQILNIESVYLFDLFIKPRSK